MPRSKPPVVPETADQREWGQQARCPRYRPDMWDTEYSRGETHVTSDNERAMEICLSCPVMMQCLGFAVEHRIAWGIWGGMVPEDRDAWAIRNGYKPKNNVLGRSEIKPIAA